MLACQRLCGLRDRVPHSALVLPQDPHGDGAEVCSLSSLLGWSAISFGHPELGGRRVGEHKSAAHAAQFRCDPRAESTQPCQHAPWCHLLRLHPLLRPLPGAHQPPRLHGRLLQLEALLGGSQSRAHACPKRGRSRHVLGRHHTSVPTWRPPQHHGCGPFSVSDHCHESQRVYISVKPVVRLQSRGAGRLHRRPLGHLRIAFPDDL
mmetsp:Transcript_7854/g.18508  ORF Transcript_7854/g.18508 Transcript_7854/m.18508 type:complete len:206 (-) Transcript_7854:203-820(-)